METEYRIGQDVVVETEDFLDGEAFLATISAEGSSSDETQYVSLGDNFDSEIILVPTEDIVTLTEVFDAVRNDERFK